MAKLYQLSAFKYLICLCILFSQSLLAAERISNYTKLKIKDDLIKDNIAFASPVFLRIFKEEGQLELWIKESNTDTYKLFRTYFICKYSGNLGPKEHQGDKMAPEGFYTLNLSSLHPYSNFHLSMDLGYPNAYDKYYKRYGSLLMIHGDCVSIGCYALGDMQIEEVYYLIEQALLNGETKVPVHAYPFRLTKENLKKHKKNHWYSFWLELQAAYQYVETYKKPPEIIIEDGRYIITK